MVTEHQDIYDHGISVKVLLQLVLALLDDPNVRDALDYNEAGKLLLDEKILPKLKKINQKGPQMIFNIPDSVGVLISNKLAAHAQRFWQMSQDRGTFLTSRNGLVLVAQYLNSTIGEILSYHYKV
jgi:hypothetical protein